MLTTGTPELEFGTLDLIDPTPADGAAYYFQALGDGSTFGNPVPVQESLDTLLTDGSKVVTRRHDNREASFMVQIIAPDSAALSDGEAALFAQCSIENTLTYGHPDGIGARTVFEVVTSALSHEWDDFSERRLIRTYTLNLIAAPFGRSETETTVAALAVGAGSETTISDGTSATGWTSPDGSVTVSSGALLVPGPATYDSVNVGDDGMFYMRAEVEATRTAAAIDFSTTPFIYFDYRIPAASPSGTSVEVDAAYADGVALNIVADYKVSSSLRRAVFYCTDSSATVLRFVFTVRRTATTAAITTTVQLDDLKRNGRSPKATSTGQASIRSLEIGGSARTHASLQVGHATSGLGDVVLFSGPRVGSGYSPDLRQYLGASQGGDSTGGSPLSGTWTTIGTSKWFSIPAASLPTGGFTLWGRLKGSSSISRALTWTAVTSVNSVNVGPTQTKTTSALALTTTARLYELGSMTLPPTEVSEGSAGTVYLTVQSGSGSEVSFDELWLFAKGEGYALTIVEAGSGTPAFGTIHNYAWVDSPNLARPMPSIWVGTDSTKADVVNGAGFVRRAGIHLFTPGVMGVYLATSGAVDALLSSRFFKRWFTFAAEAS